MISKVKNDYGTNKDHFHQQEIFLWKIRDTCKGGYGTPWKWSLFVTKSFPTVLVRTELKGKENMGVSIVLDWKDMI